MVGPTERLISKASTRKRFVLWLEVTFVISVTEGFADLDNKPANPSVQGPCHTLSDGVGDFGART
jgi:hypothetical protein